MKFDLIITIISTVISAFLIIYIIISKPNRNKIINSFILFQTTAFAWSLGNMLEILAPNHQLQWKAILFSHLPINFAAVVWLYFCSTYTNKSLFNNQLRTFFLILPALMGYLFVLTNNQYHLFYLKSTYNQHLLATPAIILAIIASIYGLLGVVFLIKDSIGKSKIRWITNFSLILVGLIPLILEIISAINCWLFEERLPIRYYPTFSFSLTSIIVVIILFRYRFLNLVPIAHKNIFSNLDQAIVVFDNEEKIVDHNLFFKKIFMTEKLNDFKDFIIVLQKNRVDDEILQKISIIKNYSIELKINNKYYHMKIKPLFVYETEYFGKIISFIDITEHKRNLELIQQNQEQLIESERLLALNQLVGSIAHNLKTPLMSCSGINEIINKIICQSEKTINDLKIENQDQESLMINFEKVKYWIKNTKEQLNYMNDVIDTVKEQVAPIDESGQQSFYINELVNKINILMNNEIKKVGCSLRFEILTAAQARIKGNINYLLQVLNILIVNAKDAYEGKKGVIAIIIKPTAGDKVDIFVSDYGKGIKEEIQKKLFKKMVTTKGKNGSGIGLYILKLIVTTKFKGEINFESQEGVGSTFVVTLPLEVDNYC